MTPLGLVPDRASGSPTQPDRAEGKELLLARLIGVGCIIICLVRGAWISDDALITLRSALNLTHGWGAGYNVVESVQAYTHPLWFLLWAAVGSVTGEWIVSIMLVGIALSAGTAAILLFQARSMAAIVLVCGVLGLSNAFVEYGTSGLENSLGALLVSILVLLSSRAVQCTHYTASAALIGLTNSALILTRMDFALLIVPPMLLVAWHYRRAPVPLLAMLAGAALPAMVWFTWSYLTYSSWLPNTLAAKANVDIPRPELVVQGIRYLWVSTSHDPMTAVGLLVSGSICLVLGSALVRLWCAGILVYLGYVVWIGGDFMAGRFLAVPLVVGVAASLLAAQSKWTRPTSALNVLVAVSAVAAVLLYSVVSGAVPTSVSPASGPKWETKSTAGIADERGWYMQYGRGLVQWLLSLGPRPDPYSFRAVDDVNPMAPIAELRDAAANWPVADRSALARPTAVGETCWLGAAGITTGPSAHWIDICGLSDRFLAALPFRGQDFQWRIGHFERPVPGGYREAVLTGDPTLVRDPALRQRLSLLWSEIRK